MRPSDGTAGVCRSTALTGSQCPGLGSAGSLPGLAVRGVIGSYRLSGSACEGSKHYARRSWTTQGYSRGYPSKLKRLDAA